MFDTHYIIHLRLSNTRDLLSTGSGEDVSCFSDIPECVKIVNCITHEEDYADDSSLDDIPIGGYYFEISDLLNSEEYYNRLLLNNFRRSLYIRHIDTLENLICAMNALMAIKIDNNSLGDSFVRFMDKMNKYIHETFITVFIDMPSVKFPREVINLVIFYNHYKDFHELYRRIKELTAYNNESYYYINPLCNGPCRRVCVGVEEIDLE